MSVSGHWLEAIWLSWCMKGSLSCRRPLARAHSGNDISGHDCRKGFVGQILHLSCLQDAILKDPAAMTLKITRATMASIRVKPRRLRSMCVPYRAYLECPVRRKYGRHLAIPFYLQPQGKGTRLAV